MKAIIIEDELASARRLERLVSNHKIEIITVLGSIKQAVDWFLKNKQPDLIFLDIHLSDGLCFDIFDRVKIDSKIIFTTAYSNYSIKAFDYNSISYLLKPIKEENLEKAIDKALKIKSTQEDTNRLKEIITNYETEIYKTSFVIKQGQRIKIIKEEEVLCFYSDANFTFIKTKDNKGVLVNSLTSLENELNPKIFFRVNRTFIVHINAIKDIISYTNYRLKIILNSFSETEIIVSRERVKDFKNWID